MADDGQSNLRRMRDIVGWSQRDLRDRSGVALATIQNIEHNRPTHGGSKQKVAKALGVPTAALTAPWHVIEDRISLMLAARELEDDADMWSVGGAAAAPAAAAKPAREIVMDDEDDDQAEEDDVAEEEPAETAPRGRPAQTPAPSPAGRRDRGTRAPAPKPEPLPEPGDDADDDAELAAAAGDEESYSDAPNESALLAMLPQGTSTPEITTAVDGIKQWLVQNEGEERADGKFYIDSTRVEQLVEMWTSNAADQQNFASVRRRARRVAGIKDEDDRKARR